MPVDAAHLRLRRQRALRATASPRHADVTPLLVHRRRLEAAVLQPKRPLNAICAWIRPIITKRAAPAARKPARITSYNVCYTKLLRFSINLWNIIVIICFLEINSFSFSYCDFDLCVSILVE